MTETFKRDRYFKYAIYMNRATKDSKTIQRMDYWSGSDNRDEIIKLLADGLDSIHLSTRQIVAQNFPQILRQVYSVHLKIPYVEFERNIDFCTFYGFYDSRFDESGFRKIVDDPKISDLRAIFDNLADVTVLERECSSNKEHSYLDEQIYKGKPYSTFLVMRVSKKMDMKVINHEKEDSWLDFLSMFFYDKEEQAYFVVFKYRYNLFYADKTGIFLVSDLYSLTANGTPEYIVYKKTMIYKSPKI